MMDLNKVELIGRLTADPEVRGSEKAVKCATVRLATSFLGKDASGNACGRSEYHSVVMFGKLGAIAGKYLKKGDRLFVSGRLQTNAWVSKEGSRKSRTEIVGDNLIMLGSKPLSRKEPVNDPVIVK